MIDTYLSRFSPSSMTPAALEALLVQRRELAQQLVDLVTESAMATSKHYTLLVGPRGIGKTHLVSTIYHRVRQLETEPNRLVIAWLREEEWGVASFLDFLMSVLQALIREYKDSVLKEQVKALYDHPKTAEGNAAKLLQDYLDGRTLLLIIENLDEVFKGLGNDGQMRLRAHIQEHPVFTILATTPRLFAGVSLQTSPFYGFFRIRHLKGLTFEEAVLLLKNIAALLGDSALANFIQSPLGRARVRAVHHLAGGNHRVYVIFSQFLSRKSLDELIEPFFRTLDDLTPYYQSRMLYLSTQQQKIIATLCDYRRPMTVKEIAERCFITNQTASSQLKSLKQLGYVESTASGRESYYELSEPLMRFTIEVKKHRVGPIRLFIDFLRLWYSRTQLEDRLTTLHPEAKYEREYVMHALESEDSSDENTLIATCVKDCRLHLRKREYSSALQAAEELVAIRGNDDDLYELGHCLGHLGRLDESLEALDQCLDVNPQHKEALGGRAGTLLNMQRFDDALSAYEKAVNASPNNDLIWGGRGWTLHNLGRQDEALSSLETASKLDPLDVRHWSCKGVVLADLGRYSEALDSWDSYIKLQPRNPIGYLNRAITLSNLDLFEDASNDVNKALDLGANSPHAGAIWYNRGVILGRAGRVDEAIQSLKKASTFTTEEPSEFLDTGAALSHVGAEKDALDMFEKAVELSPNDPHAWSHKASALFNLKRYKDSLSAWDTVIKLGDRSAAAYLTRAETLIVLDEWERAKVDLDTGLDFSSLDDSYLKIEERIVYSLFIKTDDPIKWTTRIEELVTIYKRRGVLSLLGQGLVANIERFISSNLQKELVTSWSNHWKRFGDKHEELRIPTQLLDVALRYSHKKDARVLLELPQELRSLLLPLLKKP